MGRIVRADWRLAKTIAHFLTSLCGQTQLHVGWKSIWAEAPRPHTQIKSQQDDT
jgi:hypothetical protein